MSAIDGLVKRATDDLKMRLALPFGVPVKVGVVGSIGGNGEFARIGTVRSVLNASPGPIDKSVQEAGWHVTSGKDTQINGLAKGKASTAFPKLPSASARVEVTLSEARSYLLSAKPLTISTMRDPVKLFPKMIDAFNRGVWRKNYLLVYQVAVPDYTLVIASRGRKTSVLLRAKAKADLGQVGTGDLSANFGIVAASSEFVRFDSGRQPLFVSAYRVKPHWFTGEGVVKSFAVEEGAAASDFFDDV